MAKSLLFQVCFYEQILLCRTQVRRRDYPSHFLCPLLSLNVLLVAPNFDYLRLDFCPQKLVRTDEISSIMLSQKYDNASFLSFPIDKVGQW